MRFLPVCLVTTLAVLLLNKSPLNLFSCLLKTQVAYSHILFPPLIPSCLTTSWALLPKLPSFLFTLLDCLAAYLITNPPRLLS